MPGAKSPSVGPAAVRLRWWDAAAGVSAAAVSLVLLPLPSGAFAAALALLGLFIALVDIERMIIPDLATLAMFVLGLALTFLEAPRGYWLPAVADAVLRAVAIGALLLVLRVSYQRLRGIEGLGLGDVKLAAAAGPWLMWPTLPFAIAVAAVAALVTTVIRAALARQRPQWRQELPFGAFLAPAIWVSFMLERLWLATG